MKSSSTVALDHEVEVGIKWFLVRKFIEWFVVILCVLQSFFFVLNTHFEHVHYVEKCCFSHAQD
jgi:hypothetical protein